MPHAAPIHRILPTLLLLAAGPAFAQGQRPRMDDICMKNMGGFAGRVTVRTAGTPTQPAFTDRAQIALGQTHCTRVERGQVVTVIGDYWVAWAWNQACLRAFPVGGPVTLELTGTVANPGCKG